MTKTKQEIELMKRVEEKSVVGQVRIGNSWVTIQRGARQLKVAPMGGKRYFIKFSDENVFEKIAEIK